jgi:Lambda phage tail tape-measure protein (Tape_meas_lam_C)
MPDTVQAGGLSYKLDADTDDFSAKMKKAEGDAKQAGAAMGKAFDDASKEATKSVDSFASRLIDKTVAAITALQGVSKQMGEAWEGGAEGAEKAVTDGFNGIFGKLEGGVEGLLAKIPGIWGKVAAGALAIVKGSGAFDAGFDWLKKKAAGALDDILGYVSPLTEKVSGALAAAGKSTAEVGMSFGLIDEAKLKETTAAIDSWADGVKGKLDDLVEGARTAAQKLAGTFTGIGDDVKAALATLNAQVEKQKQLNDLIGKSAGDQAALRAHLKIIQDSKKSWDDFNDAEKEGARAAEDAAKAVAADGDERKKAVQAAKDHERTIESLTASYKRQGDQLLANADAAKKSAFAHQLERAQAQAQGTGRKQGVADDPTVQSGQIDSAMKAQMAANIKFGTELDETTRKATESYRLQGATLGATAGETARLKFEQEQLNIAIKSGVPDTDALRQAIHEQGEEIAKSAQKAAEAADAWKGIQDVGKSVASSLESAFAKFTQTGQVNFRQMTQSMLQDLEKLAFRMALMPVFGGGAANPGGLLGSLAGSLLGKSQSWISDGGWNNTITSFDGFKAEGGPLEQGKWYIAGEKGPEPIWGGGSGAFATGYGNGGGPTSSGSHVTMNINLSGANGDETIARISAQAAAAAHARAVADSRAQFSANQRSDRMLRG